MSRWTLMAALVAVALISVIAGTRLDAQQAQPAADPPAPRGRVAVLSATSDTPVQLRDVAIRTIGGRAFLVGAPVERQLTATTPLTWIPVDAVVQITESGVAP